MIIRLILGVAWLRVTKDKIHWFIQQMFIEHIWIRHCTRYWRYNDEQNGWSIMVKSRGLQPPGQGWVPVCRLLGTRLHSRRWAVGWASKASSVTPHHSHYCLNHTPNPVRGKIVFRETGPWCQKGWGPLVKSIDSGTSLPGFESWLCYFLVLWAWASYPASLGLSFLRMYNNNNAWWTYYEN